MAWTKTAADRKRDRQVYEDREYVRNRAIVMRNANGRCSQCGRQTQLQCDHIIPVTQGGGHALSNLRAVCKRCHQQKTADEGGGYRQPRTDPSPRPATTW